MYSKRFTYTLHMLKQNNYRSAKFYIQTLWMRARCIQVYFLKCLNVRVRFRNIFLIQTWKMFKREEFYFWRKYNYTTCFCMVELMGLERQFLLYTVGSLEQKQDLLWFVFSSALDKVCMRAHWYDEDMRQRLSPRGGCCNTTIQERRRKSTKN